MTSFSARAEARLRQRCIALLAAAACVLAQVPAQAQAKAPNPNIGHLTSVRDRSGSTSFSYDLFGHVILKRQVLANGFAQQISYTYLPSGLLGRIDYPGGSVLAYHYDNTGRLIELDWNGQPLVTQLRWNPMGQPLNWRWAFASPNFFASRSYDTAARLIATEFSSYVYDAAGRITYLSQQLYQPADTHPLHSTIASFNVGWSVAYDPAGRIAAFNAPGNTAQFSYDANGNRTSSTRTINGQATSRSYDIDGKSNRLKGFTQTLGGATTSVAYSYNANGDLTGDGLRSYSYNAEGRLSAVTTGAGDASPTTRYAHNAFGQRMFKTEPLYPPSQGNGRNSAGGSDPGIVQGLINFFTQLWAPASSDADKLGYVFAYDEQGNLIAETGMGGAASTGSTQYIYLPTSTGAMPIAAVINGNLHAVHSDHLNTPRRIDNASGQPVWQWAYSAFGDDEPTTAATRFARPGTVTGTTSATPIVFNLRFPGQYYDAESGLHYNGRRSYRPGDGGYTQADPIGLQGGWNGRTYVDGNALTYADPPGLLKVCAIPGGCLDTSPPPVVPDSPNESGSPGLAWPKLVPQPWVDSIRNACGSVADRVKDWMLSEGGKRNTLQPGPFSGGSIPARGPGRDFSADERGKINEIGRETGCHTCGSTDAGTPSGNFIPDHQPPNAINPEDGAQDLYPHCLDCSRTQGGQVRGQRQRGGQN